MSTFSMCHMQAKLFTYINCLILNNYPHFTDREIEERLSNLPGATESISDKDQVCKPGNQTLEQGFSQFTGLCASQTSCLSVDNPKSTHVLSMLLIDRKIAARVHNILLPVFLLLLSFSPSLPSLPYFTNTIPMA